MLESVYASQEDIPEAYKDLFTEVDGEWRLTEVKGVRPAADFQTLESTLRKERTDRRDFEAKLKKFGDLDADQIQADLEELEELREADPKREDIEKQVEQRLNAKLRPVQRNLEKAERERDAAIGERDTAVSNRHTVLIDAELDKAAIAGGMDADAFSTGDHREIGRRQFEVQEDDTIVHKESGTDAATWFAEATKVRPFWLTPGESGGLNGGKGGGGGSKKWSEMSMTEQTQLFQSNKAEAQRLAQLEGVPL